MSSKAAGSTAKISMPGAELGERQAAAGDQAAAAAGDQGSVERGAELARLLRELEPGRALAGDDPRIVVGPDQGARRCGAASPAPISSRDSRRRS